MPAQLEHQVAIVTGGAAGIGRAIVQRLADDGATVVVADINEKNGREVAEAVGTDKAVFQRLDVTDKSSADATVAATLERFGRLDILVNNAGIAIRKRPEAYTADEWHRVMDTNLTAAFLCSHAAYPHFKRAGGGKVISIGSIMSMQAAPFTVAYAASKGGIVQMTRALATSWAKDNIQVNAVLPGWIDTDLTRGAREQVQGLHERVLARSPSGRWGKPDDFAGIAVFLAAPASDFVTGTAIPIDGGYSILV
jgi:2-dehydro-3-deoxy-D-gluconate 5-dehydrogenase